MATSYADIHVKVDPTIKQESEKVLNKIGISMSDLINMTLRRVIYENDIPFNTSVANSKFSSIATQDELINFLGELVSEDNNIRFSSEKVWAELDEHVKQLKIKRRHNAKVQDSLYA